jgi:hypothetical protein
MKDSERSKKITWTEASFKLLGEGSHLLVAISRKAGHNDRVVGSRVGQSGHCNIAVSNCFDLSIVCDVAIGEFKCCIYRPRTAEVQLILVSYLEHSTALGYFVKCLV